MVARKSDLAETAGASACVANGWDFAEVFRYQFRLSLEAPAPCAAWRGKRVGKWHLHHCPDLRAHEIVLGNGTKAGVVLGVAVDATGQVLKGKTKLAGISDLDALERYIEGLAGRFIVVIAAFDHERVYFDPTGGLTAVYSPEDSVVASSVHVLARRDIAPNETVTADQVLARETQFILGETCDRHCHRIRANHYLDLATLDLVRHWPRAEDAFTEDSMSREDMIAGISERLAQIIGALSGGFTTALPISGGTDSRILLAASRDCLDQIEHFYVHDIYRVTEFDRLSATRIARELGLPLQVIHHSAPGFDAMDDLALANLRQKMAHRTSLSFNGIDDATVRAVTHAPSADLVLRGNLAEMTRANKWSRELAGHAVGPEDGLTFLTSKSPEELRAAWTPERYERMLARYGAWVDTLPEPAHQRIPDLAHIEVFAPAAPNNVYYAFEQNFYINPYNDRRILHMTARFHPLARMKRQLVNGIIDGLMPELTGLPYGSHYKKLFRSLRAQGINLRGEF
ncbi:MAG: hypothetical protein RQ750_06585 [Roseovarius sp.]|nr:hypothetical protein [Roseovarius sp.]